MRLLNVLLFLTLIAAAVSDIYMYAGMKAMVLCENNPVTAKVEILAAGDTEADHKKLASVFMKNGALETVIMMSGDPLYFLRIWHKCGKCQDHMDTAVVAKGDQYKNGFDNAANMPFNYGTIEMSECRQYG
uniref:Cytidine deaminase n=1 Tax=Panagrellus redivivus TaxID=6233 RepID=A0A7E4VIN9_PANRE